MSNNAAKSRTIRELAPIEMEQVGGGAVVKAGPIVVAKRDPGGYQTKRTFNLLDAVVRKL